MESVTVTEDALEIAECDDCGNANVIDGFHAGCADCRKWVVAMEKRAPGWYASAKLTLN